MTEETTAMIRHEWSDEDRLILSYKTNHILFGVNCLLAYMWIYRRRHRRRQRPRRSESDPEQLEREVVEGLIARAQHEMQLAEAGGFG